MINFKLFTTFLTMMLFIVSCDKDTEKPTSYLDQIESSKYHDSEIFAAQDVRIYGKWKLFNISGGISGVGHDLNFEFLEIKEYGIYGFVNHGRLLEFGNIVIESQTANGIFTKISFQKDLESSSYFLEDRIKYIEFRGQDTLYLNSPCCDRYNYYFIRVK